MKYLNKTRLEIIYLSSIDWDYNWQRPQQLASRLAEKCKVIYIEPVGLRALRWKDIPRAIRRVVNWISIKKVNQNIKLYIHSTLYLPVNFNECRKINIFLLKITIKKLCRRLKFKEPIIWITLPTEAALKLIGKLNEKLVIYDCIDDYAAFQKNSDHIQRTEIEILKKSSLVFATSNLLFERMKKTNPNTYLIPNACDLSHFAKIRNIDMAISTDISNIKSPIIGYVGGVSYWFDFELVDFIARSSPKWSILIIGNIEIDRSILPVADNIYYLGQRHYTELLNYMKAFDVGIIPFKVNHLTNTINPVKLFEYLACGIPVVSTDIMEVRPYGNVISIAKTKEEFLIFLKEAIEDNSVDKIKARLKVSSENTWEKRVETILRLIGGKIKN